MAGEALVESIEHCGEMGGGLVYTRVEVKLSISTWGRDANSYKLVAI